LISNFILNVLTSFGIMEFIRQPKII
jgi:hypothetical protein